MEISKVKLHKINERNATCDISKDDIIMFIHKTQLQIIGNRDSLRLTVHRKLQKNRSGGYLRII